MNKKALALGNEEVIAWYRQLGNNLINKGIDLVCLTGTPETINLLKEEKFDLAIVDSTTKDLENTCFRISWLCRISVLVITDNASR